jgi:hypothetical protein
MSITSAAFAIARNAVSAATSGVSMSVMSCLDRRRRHCLDADQHRRPPLGNQPGNRLDGRAHADYGCRESRRPHRMPPPSPARATRRTSP